MPKPWTETSGLFERLRQRNTPFLQPSEEILLWCVVALNTRWRVAKSRQKLKETRMRSGSCRNTSLERNTPLNLAERRQILAPVVELGGARVGVIRHILGPIPIPNTLLRSGSGVSCCLQTKAVIELFRWISLFSKLPCNQLQPVAVTLWTLGS
jgi:rRNA processing protein Gar1